MKPRINIITVAVDDLEKSLAFYRDGLGLPTEGIVDSADHAAFELQSGLSFMLYPGSALARDAQENDAPQALRSSFLPTLSAAKRRLIRCLNGLMLPEPR